MPAVPGRKDATGRAARDHRPGAVRRFHPFPTCRHRLSPAVSRGRSVLLSGTVFGSRAGFLGPLFRPSDRVQDREIKFAWLAFRRRSRGCRSFSSASPSSPRRRPAFPPGFGFGFRLSRPPRPCPAFPPGSGFGFRLSVRLVPASLPLGSGVGFRLSVRLAPALRFRSASVLVSGFPSASPLPCVSARLRLWFPAFRPPRPCPAFPLGFGSFGRLHQRCRLRSRFTTRLRPPVPLVCCSFGSWFVSRSLPCSFQVGRARFVSFGSVRFWLVELASFVRSGSSCLVRFRLAEFVSLCSRPLTGVFYLLFPAYIIHF